MKTSFLLSSSQIAEDWCGSVIDNETLKQTQRNWSNTSQGGQTALKEHFAVLHYEIASMTQQPQGEHKSTIKDCKRHYVIRSKQSYIHHNL